MTKLSSRKTRLLIETADTVRDGRRFREVVIEAKPLSCSVRLKGTKTRFEITWQTIYECAAKIQADAIRREKKARKK